jgi:phage-related protein
VRAGLVQLATTSARNGGPSGMSLVSNCFGVQMGLMPNNYKPVSTVERGAYEIRVQDADGIARLMYVAKFHDTICVLHVFTTKSQKTDIDIAKKRYRETRDG